jgi:cytoplasmic iron level regulating protein YaaA (DUF328/UPF0246 family)
MKYLLAPSKKQLVVTANTESVDPSKETQLLINSLKKMTRLEIADLMKIKGALLDAVIEHIHDFQNNNAPCIEVYKGVVFDQLQLADYTDSQKLFLENHFRILSALYGVLTPSTPISPYRLDMTMKPNSMNLYDFWKRTIEDAFREEDFIVSLASKEFEKMLSFHKNKLIQVEFKEHKNGKLKSSGYKAKVLRGQLSHFIIQNKISELEFLKAFTFDGYSFDSKRSSDRLMFFVK